MMMKKEKHMQDFNVTPSQSGVLKAFRFLHRRWVRWVFIGGSFTFIIIVFFLKNAPPKPTIVSEEEKMLIVNKQLNAKKVRIEELEQKLKSNIENTETVEKLQKALAQEKAELLRIRRKFYPQKIKSQYPDEELPIIQGIPIGYIPPTEDGSIPPEILAKIAGPGGAIIRDGMAYPLPLNKPVLIPTPYGYERTLIEAVFSSVKDTVSSPASDFQPDLSAKMPPVQQDYSMGLTHSEPSISVEQQRNRESDFEEFWDEFFSAEESQSDALTFKYIRPSLAPEKELQKEEVLQSSLYIATPIHPKNILFSDGKDVEEIEGALEDMFLQDFEKNGSFSREEVMKQQMWIQRYLEAHSDLPDEERSRLERQKHFFRKQLEEQEETSSHRKREEMDSID